MKFLSKPVKVSTMSPCIYGYEDESDCEPGSAWESKTYRNRNVTISRHRCVATDCQPTRCRVGATFITVSW